MDPSGNELRPDLVFGTRDIIVEHQRGMMVLGYPFFSPNLLLHGVDPPQFQLVSPDGQSVEKGEIKAGAGMWPLDLHSKAEEFKWFVSMDHGNMYETDDQGWTYGWRFRSKRWKAASGFVRKRFWVRLRENSRELTPAMNDPCSERIAGVTSETLSPVESTSTSLEADSGFEKLLLALSKLPLDRQKAEKVVAYIDNLPPDEKLQMLQQDSPALKRILQQFQFKESKARLVQYQLPKVI
ncbi:LADA_0A05798g1_1 [Lachancea dasiensis]|uniref:LADA_0A05798g1_1 n=1 Tax=Lachancea dasiensis TaxID=1072105 RepID=A0A1G4IP95_9SACH|nr:LADA_0A05798g1_1 [Lachancea dasiensis]